MLLLPNRFDGLRGRYRSARLARTCSTAIYDLQSAYQTAFAYQTTFGLYPLLFYKESALFFGFYSGFTRDEYHVIRVDFIVALRRTKGRGRRTLRSPPSPSSGLHLIHPGDPLRRGMNAAAVDRDIVSRIPVQVDNRQFRILCSFLCSGWNRSRFSWVVWLWSFVFHYW